MIYLAEQGVFDMSYAAAWNIGRSLALADAHFAQAINRYVRGARTAAATIAERRALPHFAGDTDSRTLLAADASRRRFAELVGGGLGQEWTAALGRARQGSRPDPAARSRVRVRPAEHARELWARADTAAAVSEHLREQADPVADWLANLALLYPVPFSHLVPDPRMLPVDSIRFFYVDPDWVDALEAGACSIALHHSGDVAAFRALHPHLAKAVAEKTAAALCPSLSPTRRSGGFGPHHDDRHADPLEPGVELSRAGGHGDRQRGRRSRLRATTAHPRTSASACSPASPTPSRSQSHIRACCSASKTTGLSRAGSPGAAPQIGQPIAGTSVPAHGGYAAFVKTYCRTETGGVMKIGDLAA